MHIILGGHHLRAHDHVAYFWNDYVGFFSKFEGLFAETIYAELKTYLLSLEGLFRSFIGDVPRNDAAVLDAIDASYTRHQRDPAKARAAYIDNAIFHLGSVGSKGKGAGKGRKSSLAAASGQLEADLAALIEADESAAENAIAGADAAGNSQNEPRYIFIASNIYKISYKLQTQLQGKELMTYYCEWCSVPKPGVKGVAYIDAAFLYGVGSSEHVRQTLDMADRRNIYVGIPHKLNGFGNRDPVLEAAKIRVQTFYRQTFWANSKPNF